MENNNIRKEQIMRKLEWLGYLIVIIVFFFSCSSDSPTDPITNNNNTNTSSDLSTFSEIQKKVFNPTCAVSGCHTGANPPNNLDLSEGNAYGNLVDVNSVENSTLKRVQPGDDSQSLLIKKLKGDGTSRMPPMGSALSNDVIDSVAKWINLGAANN